MNFGFVLLIKLCGVKLTLFAIIASKTGHFNISIAVLHSAFEQIDRLQEIIGAGQLQS